MAGPLNKHQQRTEVTRKKLLAAGLRVFSRDGFERSRLEDIAAEAGHTRGALYANFDSKEDLFIALLEQQAAKRAGRISRVLDADLEPDQRRWALRDFYLRRAKDRQWILLMLEFKLYALRHSRHRARFAAAHRRIRESFHLELMTRLKAPWTPGGPTETHAKILLEVIGGGLVLEHAYDPKRISSDEVEQLLGRMFDLLIDAG